MKAPLVMVRVYSIDREKLHQIVLPQELLKNISEADDQMFISGKMAFRIILTALQQKKIVFLMKRIVKANM